MAANKSLPPLRHDLNKLVYRPSRQQLKDLRFLKTQNRFKPVTAKFYYFSAYGIILLKIYNFQTDL